MFPSSVSFIVFIIILSCVVLAFGRVCDYDEMECRTSSHCIYQTSVCDGSDDCGDGSDEDPDICQLWDLNYYSGYDYSIIEFCESSHEIEITDPRFCELVFSGRLQLPLTEEEEPEPEPFHHIKVQSQTASIITGKREINPSFFAVLLGNVTTEGEFPSCPLLYSRVGDHCVSFFTPAKIPWPEARVFCQSISGDLLSFSDAASYVLLLEYISTSGITSDFWVGGRYSSAKNAWVWAKDNASVKMGSPYWAVRYTSKCIPRSPARETSGGYGHLPHDKTDRTCYFYQQAPQHNAEGWCTALTYEQYYFMSDQSCKDLRSPLCLHIP